MFKRSFSFLNLSSSSFKESVVLSNSTLCFCNLAIVASNLTFPLSIFFFALFIRLYGIPFFSATSKVNELPACPNTRLKVGSNVLSLNCMFAFDILGNSFANNFRFE